ncbi:MAG: carboxylesterase family protein [Cytophagales bacterium]|nr:carboxylesterase family protein [Rhizobacter sp.]
MPAFRRAIAAAFALTLAHLLTACGGSDDPAPPPPATPPTASTQYGTLEGSLHSTGSMRQFLGIPYAAPPVGELRWKAPAPPASWSGTRSATSYGRHCPQKDTSPLSSYGTAGGQEDCLYLNVFTPTTTGPHPVMVWIHGGAFLYGRGAGYTPARLTAQGVVVVSINYRLGTLGFLAHPALNDAQGRSGNYGVMDQTAALQWVKNNIHHFGGDPSNITIAGQSAGAASVLTQLNTAKTLNLFNKVVLQSGPVTDQPTGAAAQTSGATVGATSFGCPNDANAAACLRALSVDFIVANQPAATFSASNSPNVDGDYLVRTNLAATYGGLLANKVPVLIGNTVDEYTSLLAGEETALNNPGLAAGSPASALVLPGAPGYVNLLNTDAALTARLTATFGPMLAPVVAVQYPAANYGGSRPLALSAAVTDYLFACGTRRAAKALQASGVPVYAYEFNDANAPMALQPAVSFPFKAYHASEIQYLFDLPSTASLTTAQRALADQMATHWANFVKSRTGNPNSAGSTAWPPYTVGEEVLQFAPTGSSVITNFSAAHKCTSLWTPGI